MNYKISVVIPVKNRAKEIHFGKKDSKEIEEILERIVEIKEKSGG